VYENLQILTIISLILFIFAYRDVKSIRPLIHPIAFFNITYTITYDVFKIIDYIRGLPSWEVSIIPLLTGLIIGFSLAAITLRREKYG